MILARFFDASNKQRVSRGTSRIAGYSGEDEGWFPIESFDFGFNNRDEDKGPAQTPPGPGGKPAGNMPAHGPKTGGSGDKKKEDLAVMNIAKVVDATSVSLMQLVMEERKSGLGRNEKKPIEVDIHVISTISLEDMDEPMTFTSLIIHLEAVNVTSWKINGTGDSRPTETVTVKYDRAAMIYVELDKQRNRFPYGPKGWDQNSSKSYGDLDAKFRWSKGDYGKYLP
jgi:hypothetical protein